jgi:hypothetical protein
MYPPYDAMREQQTQQVRLVAVLLAEPRLEFGLDEQKPRHEW